MFSWRILLFLIFLSLTIVSTHSQTDTFNEELIVKPLETGHVYMHFQFTTKWDVELLDKSSFLHYHLFPKSLGEVLAKYSVQELHLTQTQGLWKHDKWGYPLKDAAPGAELWVWFQQHTRNVDEQWTDLINVLSGIFCASLNFMDSKNTVSPLYSFRPEGAASQDYLKDPGNIFRYAALPHEMVCTENLTPWKKLLPCASKSGLASLFNAIKLYDASYHSLSIDFRPVCQNAECTVTSLELSQSLSIVFDPTVMNGGKQDWSFKKLFSRMLSTSCPLAENSLIYVDVSTNRSIARGWHLNPPPQSIDTVQRGNKLIRYAKYDIPKHLAENNILNLEAKYNGYIYYAKVEKPVLLAHRYQTGYGQEKGGISCLIYNHHPSQDIAAVYMETIPWFLRVYFHTLKIEYFLTDDVAENGTSLKPFYKYFVPGQDRKRPYHLEVTLLLPANSRTKISVEFDRALLKWTEYPPDANHGFYVNSAVISAVLPSDAFGKHYIPRPFHSSSISASMHNTSDDEFIRLHTETLLITLPTPDFSMPYNVICLACTVVAIAFGSIHNLTTRRFVIHDPSKKKGLKDKIKAFINKIRGKKPVESAPSESEVSVAEKDKGEGCGQDTESGSENEQNDDHDNSKKMK